MTPHPLWRGVRLRRIAVGADPDAAPRLISLPTGWEESAAAALAALAPGQGPVALPTAATAWIAPLAARASHAATAPLDLRLHRLLLCRQAAPDAAVWQGRTDTPPRFVLNLAGFFDPELGFDTAAFVAAMDTVRESLTLLAVPQGPLPSIGVADLAGLLARLGLDYASEAARNVARAVGEILRQHSAVWPGAGAAEAIIAVAAPGRAEALLGVETGGIAPAFSPLAADLQLSRAARGWLAAIGLAPETALAGLLAGASPFPTAGVAAQAAMHAALAPFLHVLPPTPTETPAPRALPVVPSARRRDLPPRRTGYTQKASVGGHRLFLRTGEYADGALGEISITLPKESPAVRALMDGFCAAVSLGLQHGVPLGDFVDAFLQTRFAPAGVVEGDPAVAQAASVLDYMVRHLAANYLPHHELAAPEPEDSESPAAGAPLLPLELPEETSVQARRRRFRVIAR